MSFKKLTIKERHAVSKPWISPPILKKIEKRNALFKKKSKDPNNSKIQDEYKILRIEIQRDIKISNKEHYAKYFEDSKNNMKKTWKGINELIKNRTSTTFINQLGIENNAISKPEEISNTFNNLFVNVGKNTDKTIPETPILPTSFILSNQ